MENSNDIVKESYELTDKSNTSSQRDNRRPPKLCIYYSNYEFCKYGDSCKFLHIRKPVHRQYVSKPFLTSRIKNSQSQTDTPVSSSEEKVPFKRVQILNKNYNYEKLCRFYKAGRCDQGDKCLYSHSVDNENKSYTYENLKSVVNDNKTSRPSTSKKMSVPICQYYKRGYCNKGNRCKFNHPLTCREINRNRNVIQSLLENETVSRSQTQSVETNSMDKNSDQCEIEEVKTSEEFPPFKGTNDTNSIEDRIEMCKKMPLRSNQVINLSSSDSEILQSRFTEIMQFMKRFPSHEVIEDNKSFSFSFQPTDPDWPFDMKIMKLEVVFPELYPKEICDISVVQSSEYIPEKLLKHLNQSISNWLSKKHELSVESQQMELIFRPFLKWFDKNLVDLFNVGLNRVTEDKEINYMVELDSVQDLNQLPSTSFDIKGMDVIPQNTEISVEEIQITKEIQKVSISAQKHTPNANFCSSQKQGVKVLFIGLELIEGVAALTCTKVSATLQCIRCKTSHNIKTTPNRNHSVTCSKCSKSIECNFNPSLLHQYSNVLGTVHLLECQVVDLNLVECHFLIDCLNCSKQVGADGIHYGQKQKLWCRFCNQKLVLGIGSVKFQASAPSSTATKSADKPTKKTEKKKDPLIKEGSPLPQFGACKHYKKSNRWLRFPCCGRVYPCDVCHDEKEMDHEMKFASRMICGFCSKEQPYSKDKPCVTCGSGVVAKSGAHWEGGKGCRNKVNMYRDDKHKYVGTCKTVSKKSKSVGSKKK